MIIGIIIIIFFYTFSANLKSLYLNIKYQYSNTGDHLAVVNEDGLWIKEKRKNDNIFIINALNYKKDKLENVKITELNENYKLINTLVSAKANIEKKLWKLSDVKIYSENKKTDYKVTYEYFIVF